MEHAGEGNLQRKAGRHAVVVGATSGIGLEVARKLAEKGWKVGIAGRRTDRLKQLMVKTEGIVACECIDVTEPDAPQKLEHLIAALGGMDLYFHSSGIGWQNMELDAEKELLTVQTNAVGFVRMVGAAFRHLATAQRPGRLACITSIAGTKGLGAAPAYSATKRFQSHYLECLDQQARMRGLPISVTDIRPGFVRTPLIEGSRFPLQMDASNVASAIVRAIEYGCSVKVLDWRYVLLTSLWDLIPRWLWVRMPVR